MSGEHLLAPVEHLKHLLRKHKDGKPFGSKDLLEQASGGTDARAEVVEALEKAFPGTRQMLDQTWRWHGATAVHLWQLPTLSDHSEKTIIALVKKTLKVVPTQKPTELDGELTEGGQARVLGVELRDGILLVTVRKAAWKSWQREGEQKRDVQTEDIEVALDLNRSRAILEVYATLQNARVAAGIFVGSVMGVNLPREKPEREKILKPVVFSESTAASVANRLKMGEESGLVGFDAKNEHGELHMYGKKRGTITLPLAKSKRFKDQVKAKNDIREFLLTFKHDDGYVHESNVQFYLKSKQHPHLKFINKTSRPAVYRVVDEVCDLSVK